MTSARHTADAKPGTFDSDDWSCRRCGSPIDLNASGEWHHMIAAHDLLPVPPITHQLNLFAATDGNV